MELGTIDALPFVDVFLLILLMRGQKSGGIPPGALHLIASYQTIRRDRCLFARRSLSSCLGHIELFWGQLFAKL
jgi:hypothetical protein